jgi:AcrR family transcriptional regulator
VSSPATRRPDRRRARNRAAILDAGDALIAEGGLGALSIEAVAERADVAIATLYAHVGGRGGLLVALAERAIARNADAFDAALGEAPEASAPAQLAAIGQGYLRFHLENPAALRVLSTREALEDPGVQRAARALVRRVATVVEAGQADGDLRTDVDPARVARFLWGAWNGVLSLHARGAVSRPELERTLGDALLVLLDGLAARGRA